MSEQTQCSVWAVRPWGYVFIRAFKNSRGCQMAPNTGVPVELEFVRAQKALCFNLYEPKWLFSIYMPYFKQGEVICQKCSLFLVFLTKNYKKWKYFGSSYLSTPHVHIFSRWTLIKMKVQPQLYQVCNYYYSDRRVIDERAFCMISVCGVTGLSALHNTRCWHTLMYTFYFKKSQGHFRWWVLTQSCAHDLITLSVCLWIYTLDLVIITCPSPAWTLSADIYEVFFCTTIQWWRLLMLCHNKCIHLNKNTDVVVFGGF